MTKNPFMLMSVSARSDGACPTATKLTSPPGINLVAHWGELRVHLNP